MQTLDVPARSSHLGSHRLWAMEGERIGRNEFNVFDMACGQCAFPHVMSSQVSGRRQVSSLQLHNHKFSFTQCDV